jgi:hypothetical protein
MRLLFSLLSFIPLLSLVSLPAMASADCPVYPKAEWAAEETLKTALKEEGYSIKKFKLDGNCYEMYGKNKAGKKVELYFDTKTLAIIKAEVEN